jgi:hypothetical protein
MLLAPVAAQAQIRDGNLIEYGIAGFTDDEGEMIVNAPKMKIFRDGRVLIVDDQGARQGHISSDRIENLRRDLVSMPLLHATRYVEFARRQPMPHGGGLSYIRFLDGDDEVVLATPGIALDRDWTGVIDRVNVERPTTLTAFQPEQIRFYVFSWPAFGEKVAWPFTSTVPLTGRGDDPIIASDPDVIAFIIRVTYNSNGTRPGVEEDNALYQFGVDSAPGWMDPPAIAQRLKDLWRAAPRHSRGAGALDGNLIEYGMGGFSDGGHGPPMLYPPEVKIYNDGRIVFADKVGYWQGTIESKRFKRLERDLANDGLLKKSQLVPVRNGGLISMHGGMAYIRYRDGDDAIVVAALSHPHRGAYPRLLDRIRAEIPGTYSRFRPTEITFRLYPGSTWVEPVVWPFSATTPLRGRSDSITVTDPAAIAFVIDHSFGGFSWLQTNVRENGTDYEIILESAPGWYEPGILGSTLDDLRLSPN